MTASKIRTSSNGKTPHAETISVKNPVTGAEIGEIAITSEDEIAAVVKRARTAQRMWQAMSVSERCKLLLKFQDLLWEHQREVMDTIRAETGKNDTGAFIEIAIIDSLCAWLANHAPRILAPQRRAPGFPVIQSAKVYYKPHGIVGFITPWNYPAALVYLDALPALAAGNAIIIKPSEVTPFSASHIMRLLHQAGIPHELVQVVTGDGATGSALIDYVDCIHFTGSTPIGKKVAVKASERLIPYTLELGSKDSLIVLKDANLDLAASGALTGAFENAGQMCISIKRAYIEDAIYDEFMEKLQVYLAQFTIGSGNGFEVNMGSMTREQEIERVERHVQDAIDKGANLIYGGKRRPDLGPLFYEPAVLTNVDHSMLIMREETFGPVLPIMRVKNEAEAIRLANDSEFGLSSVIYTSDLARGEHLARQLETGDVGINRPSAAAAGHWLPWGGRKNSGVGQRGGPEGLLRFVSPQTIVVDTTLGSQPALSLVSPMIMTLVKALRVIRRYVSFV